MGAQCCGHDHDHGTEDKSIFQLFLPSIIAGILLFSGILLEHFKIIFFINKYVQLGWYLVAFLLVGIPVLKQAFSLIKKGDLFNEFTLMSLASIGAFYIDKYPEAVSVMLFYILGETLQELAVSRASKNISDLLDKRPDTSTVVTESGEKPVKSEEVKIGDIIALKVGEKAGLDGVLVSNSSFFDTSALTGESKPETKKQGDDVYAGMINLNTEARYKVTVPYEDSKLSKILDLIKNSSEQKTKTEQFISRFAKIYTPIVFLLSLLVFLLPAFILPTFYNQEYHYQDWLYKALIFLVISCPCALVISIPLGYFGGIGLASKNGILVKGANYLDILANVSTVVADKTGTLTEGVFAIQDIKMEGDKKEILEYVNSIERVSTHPIASAIRNHISTPPTEVVTDIVNVDGKGLKGKVGNKEVLAGNFKLLDDAGIIYDKELLSSISKTVIAVAIDNKFAGYITISDKIKPETKEAISKLRKENIDSYILSGDKQAVVEEVANEIGVTGFYGELLPEDKVNQFKEIQSKQGKGNIAFVGDGLNDAPVIALSDVGLAMGGLGSDASIEAADVIIQDDNPIKIYKAIKIGKKTRQIVWQNIILAFSVKIIVLILGTIGLADLWEAVIADVGVAFLAILNAIRLQNIKIK